MNDHWIVLELANGCVKELSLMIMINNLLLESDMSSLYNNDC